MDKSLLLEEINAFIRENSTELNSLLPDVNVSDEKDVPTSLTEKLDSLRGYMPVSKILQAIARAEQRIEALEKQNDNLLYFIHFIYEHFSELASGFGKSENAVKKIKDECRPLSRESQHSSLPRLTQRESEVLDCLVKGFGVKEIASKLFISQNTVITHKKNLKEKFNARNTVDMISKAFQLSQ